MSQLMPELRIEPDTYTFPGERGEVRLTTMAMAGTPIKIEIVTRDGLTILIRKIGDPRECQLIELLLGEWKYSFHPAQTEEPGNWSISHNDKTTVVGEGFESHLISHFIGEVPGYSKTGTSDADTSKELIGWIETWAADPVNEIVEEELEEEEEEPSDDEADSEDAGSIPEAEPVADEPQEPDIFDKWKKTKATVEGFLRSDLRVHKTSMGRREYTLPNGVIQQAGYTESESLQRDVTFSHPRFKVNFCKSFIVVDGDFRPSLTRVSINGHNDGDFSIYLHVTQTYESFAGARYYHLFNGKKLIGTITSRGKEPEMILMDELAGVSDEGEDASDLAKWILKQYPKNRKFCRPKHNHTNISRFDFAVLIVWSIIIRILYEPVRWIKKLYPRERKDVKPSNEHGSTPASIFELAVFVLMFMIIGSLIVVAIIQNFNL